MSSTTSPTAGPSPDHIDLGRVVRAVSRKLPVLLVLSGIVGAGTAGVLSTMSPKYLSQAQLEVRGTGGSDLAGRPDKEAVGTHVRGLMSTELALKMSAALELTKHPDFNSALPPADLYGRLWRMAGVSGAKAGETDEDRLMQAYFKAVRAYQVRDTRSIIVDCTTSSAKSSADCANVLADLYRNSLSGRATSESSDLRAKLAPQVERLTREAAEAESVATEFRGKANLFQGGAQATLLKDQQLSEITAELTRAATARSDAEARATAAREMNLRGMAAANPDVQKSALIPRMDEQRVTLERQISELSATLLRGHPRMKQLASELAGLQTQIRTEVQKVVESLGNDARIAADREAGVRRRLDDMKRTVVTSAPDSAKLVQLENQAKTKRAELERLQRQYEAAASSAGAGVGAVEVEIVSRAYPSNEKVFPKIGTMAPLAAFATLMLGFALTLTRELVRGARPVVSGATSVATVASTFAAKPAADATTSITSATARTVATTAFPPATIAIPSAVATAIAKLATGERGFRVLIAPAVKAGAEAEALALAEALARDARVILLGWNGGGEALAMAAGVQNSVGTAQLLTGDASLEEATQRLAGTALDVIAAGVGGDTIDGDSAALLLDTLDEMYDFIVVCAPTAIAAGLFAAVQGRFDAGVLVTDTPLPTSQNGTSIAFLGFDVADFPVLGIGRSSGRTDGIRQAPRRDHRVRPAVNAIRLP